MNANVKRGLTATLVVAVALGAAACSQGPSSSSDGDGTFDENTGALVAHLRRIPDDVRCIEISTSDWRNSQVRVDVEPGNEATIRIAPLQPGWLSFWGTTYRVPCHQIWSSDGGPYANQTWIADYASAYVNSGRPTPITLLFRKLGSADVSVDFADPNSCDPDGGAMCPPPQPPFPDGGLFD
jgi:hypothetical protein